MIKKLIICLFLFLVGACSDFNQENSKQKTMENKYGEIKGKVVNKDGFPVVEATVSIASSPSPVPDLAALTNINGEFSFGDLEFGMYKLRIIKEDFNEIKSVKLSQKVSTIEIRIPE